MTLETEAQRIIELATGSKAFKADHVSRFDYCHVITSEPYNVNIDDKGKLTEWALMIRIGNEFKDIFNLSICEMPMDILAKYQDSLRIQNKNYFERSIHNLPLVINALKDLGYTFSEKERFFQ